MTWTAVLVLGVGAYLLKLLGVLVGNRITNARFRAAISLIPAALFCALIALQTFEDNATLVVDARASGLVAAALAAWRKVPFIGVIAAGMAATALTRYLAG